MNRAHTGTAHAARSSETRERILTAAEELFAEYGVFAVSNRQVGEAAGQRNSSVVGYHFGAKIDLVVAIFHRHNEAIEQHRIALLQNTDDFTDLRKWVACLVDPYVHHLETLGAETFYARFSAQVMTDPTLRRALSGIALSSPSLRATLRGLERCVSDMPESVQRARADMARQLLVHMSAERERAMHDTDTDSPGHHVTEWRRFADDLIDAIVGVWTAPVHPPRQNR